MHSTITIEDELYFRQTLFDKAKRVVVKVGSAILTGENGINKQVVDNLAREISFLHNSEREVILVTSGESQPEDGKYILAISLSLQ